MGGGGSEARVDAGVTLDPAAELSSTPERTLPIGADLAAKLWADIMARSGALPPVVSKDTAES